MTHQHPTTPPVEHLTLTLSGLHCPGCADAVERALRAQPHVVAVHLDWARDEAHVSYHAGMITPDELGRLVAATGCTCRASDAAAGEHATHAPAPARRLQHLRHAADVQPITQGTKQDRLQYELLAGAAHAAHAGHAAAPAEAVAAGDHAGHAGMDHDLSDPGMAAAMERDLRTKFVIALALTIPTVLYSPLGANLLGVSPPTFGLGANPIMLLLSTPVVWYAGWLFIAGAYHSLRRRALNMSVLVATGVLAAYLASLLLTVLGRETFYEAAAMLVTFVLFGHWMEMRARRGTNEALRALFDLVPPQATVVRDGQEVVIPSAAVRVGDIVILRPGDKVPVDGVVIAGETSIDEALVTGESVPVTKRPGDTVIAGALNQRGSIRFRATRVGADTTLAQIAALVQQAQASKAPGQRLADRAAQYLVVLAVGVGLVTFVVWAFIVRAPFVDALTFAVSAVVIACPDALGLATPTAVAVGTGLGARRNILIKDAATLEGIARLDAVVLDKTGTLTEGKPALTDVVPAEGFDADALLRLVAGAEGGSEHPLAAAIVAGARARGLALPEAAAFEAVAGQGIRATVEGRTLLVGNRALMDAAGVDVAALAEQAAALAEAGKTPVYVAIDGRPAGLVAVADTVKATAPATVRWLHQHGIEVVMLTGDNRRTAAAVARSLGIERVFAEVLPADKAGYVRRLQAEGKRVGMVGDGVNDAPALATADVGIAIGAGTDVAIETARVVLMKSDPLDVVRAILLARATVAKMKQNLVWASVYNVLAIPVAAGLLYPSLGLVLRPEWSALLMSLSSIIVAVNAVLLKRVDRELELPEAGSGVRPAAARAAPALPAARAAP